jgi:pimeloyl-ACP methyl ester carboxylesterase
VAAFLLVHGANHGAWCWRDLIPALETRGHTARAIDLPGHGEDPTPRETVTMDSYRDAIVAALAPGDILVGHSIGGYSVTAAAEAAPGLPRALVYLAAYIPAPGRSLASLRRAEGEQLLDRASRVEDGLVYMDETLAAPLFYNDCPPEAVAFALPRLTPQPVAPFRAKVETTERSRAIPRHAILCTDDRTVLPRFQEAMAAGLPAQHIHPLDTGHSPFFSAPARLAGVLDTIAKALP